MIQFKERVEEVAIINKNGCRTIMPDVGIAKSYAGGIWKGYVDKIEVKTIIKVEDE